MEMFFILFSADNLISLQLPTSKVLPCLNQVVLEFEGSETCFLEDDRSCRRFQRGVDDILSKYSGGSSQNPIISF